MEGFLEEEVEVEVESLALLPAAPPPPPPPLPAPPVTLLGVEDPNAGGGVEEGTMTTRGADMVVPIMWVVMGAQAVPMNPVEGRPG